MADLKVLFEDLKFQNVTTFIQSGNVIFKTDNAKDLPKRIEQKIFEKYSFHVPVLIRTSDEMQTLLDENPFLKENNIDQDKLHVTFLAKNPEKELTDKFKIADFGQERFSIIGKEVFLYCPDGYGRAKLTNNFFENKLKVIATTRNWKTVNKLSELAIGV